MNRKTNALSHSFKIVRVFREDLEEIEHIIKEELGISDVKISTHDYEYDSVSEIPTNIEPIHELKINGYKPLVSVELNDYSSKVYLSENSVKALGAFTKIVEILKKRERRLLHFIVGVTSWFGPAFAIVSLLGAALFKNAWSLLFGAISLGLGIWSFTAYKIDMNRHSTIVLVNKVDRPNFFKRNRDNIIISLVSTIVGAILGVLGTIFIKG